MARRRVGDLVREEVGLFGLRPGFSTRPILTKRHEDLDLVAFQVRHFTVKRKYRDVPACYSTVQLPYGVAVLDRQRHGRAQRRARPEHVAYGQRFESLEEAQAYLDRWERKWAYTGMRTP